MTLALAVALVVAHLNWRRFVRVRELYVSGEWLRAARSSEGR